MFSDMHVAGRRSAQGMRSVHNMHPEVTGAGRCGACCWQLPARRPGLPCPLQGPPAAWTQPDPAHERRLKVSTATFNLAYGRVNEVDSPAPASR